MAEYKRSEIVSGLFIILALVVFALFAFKISGMDPFWFLRAKAVNCVTYLPDVQTLTEGVKVTVSGQRVGQVRKISLASAEEVRRFWEPTPETERPKWARGELLDAQFSKVEFELEARHDLAIDRSNARALLVQEGFLGTHYLKLDIGKPSQARPAADMEQPIPVLPGPGGGLEGLLNSGQELVDEIRGVLRKVDEQILSEKNIEAINSLLARLDRMGAEAEGFMKELPKYVTPENEASVDKKLLDPARNLIRNLDESVDQLRNRILDVTMAKVDAALDEGRKVIASAQSALDKADGMLAEGGPKVQGILDDLKTNTAALQGRLDALQKEITDLLVGAQGTVGDLRSMLAENRPELAETLQAARRIMWEAELLVRKVKSNPAVLIWGDDEPVLDVAPLDEDALRRSGRARPFGQRQEGGDGK